MMKKWSISNSVALNHLGEFIVGPQFSYILKNVESWAFRITISALFLFATTPSQSNGFYWGCSCTAWPDKNRQKSVKVTQK